MEHKIKSIERFCSIYKLIQQEQTGSPEQLAARFHISRRTLYRVIEELEDMGAPVKFSRSRNTFFFEDGFQYGSKPFFHLKLQQIVNNL